MWAGFTTRLAETTLASAATITPKADLVKVSGTTSLETIRPPFLGFSGVLFIVPTDGNVATVTTGNIAVAVTMPQNRVTALVFSKINNKWYPGAIS